MRLFDVDFRYLDELDPMYTLKTLYDVTGNCPETGYLEDEFIECGYTKEHDLEFATRHIDDSMDVKTVGIVLPTGVTLKQTRTAGDVSTNYLYSWDTRDNEYSYVCFDSLPALEAFYNRVTADEVNLCDVDIDEYAKENGLFGIIDAGPRQQLDPFKHVMDDYVRKTGSK